MGKNVVIIGAGPSGLGCGYELTKEKSKDFNITIIDKNDIPGGLARTYAHKGHYFDLGPHRFYTKNKKVLSLWKEMLGNNFKIVPRKTRILYKKNLFSYPISIYDVVDKLGIVQSVLCVCSFLFAKITFIHTEPKTFEEWVIKHFGNRLYHMFFKTYTEKVWGISCKQIGSEWATQRIRNLNMLSVLRNALPFFKHGHVKSLVDKFYYPTNGAGMMYEALAKIIKKNGGQIIQNGSLTKIYHKKNQIISVEYSRKSGKKTIPVSFLFTSMPITTFILSLHPKPPKNILDAANKLFFRDHITINVIVNKSHIFPDNWIYIHSPEIKIARIANYNNFGTNHKRTTSLSLEYFTFSGDKISQKSDDELIIFAKEELEKTGLVEKKDILDVFIIREKDAYPTYYMGYQNAFLLLKNYVSTFINAQSIGRAGMYKYNNMDHALLSGIYAAQNYKDGTHYDIWNINEEAEYLEEIKQ